MEELATSTVVGRGAQIEKIHARRQYCTWHACVGALETLSKEMQWCMHIAMCLLFVQ